MLKWVVFVIVVVRYWRAPYFWWALAAAIVLSVAIHLFWRWKTKGWTEPWGGWNDVEAGRER